MICDRWDVILAPYPYVEVFEAKLRPSLVLTTKTFNSKHKVCFAAMITTAKSMTDLRDDDFQISDVESAGLKRPCVIRMSRLSTIDLSDDVRLIGKLDKSEQGKIEKILKSALGV